MQTGYGVGGAAGADSSPASVRPAAQTEGGKSAAREEEAAL